jgi:hypothetical protein
MPNQNKKGIRFNREKERFNEVDKMIKKNIIWFGKPYILQCDDKCELSKGINKGKILSEGGHLKPYKDSMKLNKWCARECERSELIERTDEVD